MAMIETTRFSKWLKGLKDPRAKGLIASRVDRLSFGHPGDAGPVGEGVSELRIHFGPGYRVYYKGNHILCGGTKATQKKDIKLAKKIASELK